jgi:hypothetical protein
MSLQHAIGSGWKCSPPMMPIAAPHPAVLVSHIETHRSGTGFGAFAAACMQRQNVSATASFSRRESHDAVANVGDSGCQSVGKIGDKQTSE